MGLSPEHVSSSRFHRPKRTITASTDSTPSASITAHPSVPYYAVINPNSGPGDANTQPGLEYQQCIPILKAASSSVTVLGYVATFEADSAKAAGVLQDVHTYAQWDSSYGVQGIFFDQVSGATADFAAYQNYTGEARKTFNFASIVKLLRI